MTNYVKVAREDLLQWASDWARDNSAEDDTDVVTPFDGYLLSVSDQPDPIGDIKAALEGREGWHDLTAKVQRKGDTLLLGGLCVTPTAESHVAAPWRGHEGAMDTMALAVAREIALMWGSDRGQLVRRIQSAVRGAMDWIAAGTAAPSAPVGAAEAQPVGRSGVLKRQVVTTYRDGSVRVAPLADRPSAPVGVEGDVLSRALADAYAHGERRAPFAFADCERQIREAHAQQPAMDRKAAIDHARIVAWYMHDDHEYLPETLDEASSWVPHEWVIEAIMQARQPAAMDEFAEDRNRLLRAFMQECGVIGPEKAGVNLARGIKAALAAHQVGES